MIQHRDGKVRGACEYCHRVGPVVNVGAKDGGHDGDFRLSTGVVEIPYGSGQHFCSGECYHNHTTVKEAEPGATDSDS